jgi:hypothetical protein
MKKRRGGGKKGLEKEDRKTGKGRRRRECLKPA